MTRHGRQSVTQAQQLISNLLTLKGYQQPQKPPIPNTHDMTRHDIYIIITVLILVSGVKQERI